MRVGAGPVIRRVVVVKLQVCVVDIHGVGSGEVDATEVRTLDVGGIEGEHIEWRWRPGVEMSVGDLESWVSGCVGLPSENCGIYISLPMRSEMSFALSDGH